MRVSYRVKLQWQSNTIAWLLYTRLHRSLYHHSFPLTVTRCSSGPTASLPSPPYPSLHIPSTLRAWPTLCQSPIHRSTIRPPPSTLYHASSQPCTNLVLFLFTSSNLQDTLSPLFPLYVTIFHSHFLMTDTRVYMLLITINILNWKY